MSNTQNSEITNTDGSGLKGTIGGIYEPFVHHVKQQLDVRKIIVSSAKKVNWGSLKVQANYRYWRDKNQDGLMDDDELLRTSVGHEYFQGL